jgi:hypothetical protein
MGQLSAAVVGYDRLVGEQAYRQLTELYRALRLYINCFQPSMKLQSKLREGKKVRYVYDLAKTPLQRLLLSGVLPVQKHQELIEVAQALDPIRLFQQVGGVQKAVFRCAVSCSPCVSNIPSAPIRVFSAESCIAGNVPAKRNIPDAVAELHTLYREQERRKRALGWRRTQKDPFEGEREKIASWVLADPQRSSGDIFRELRRLSPGRYQPLQIRTDTSRDAENTSPSAGNVGGAMAGRSDQRTISCRGLACREHRRDSLNARSLVQQTSRVRCE